MSIVTIIGDIHLNTYKSYSFYNGFRDEQFIRAANRVVQISKENNSKILFIAGDLIDSPIIKPRAQHLLEKFLKILANYYDKIYYILGQHDVNSKVKDWDYEDTIINLFNDFKVMEYVNKETIEIDGKKIYCQDWIPSNNVTCPEGTDLFVSHVTLSPLFGIDIDKSKFKLGIFGDIHSIYDEDNCHTIGGFLQKSMSDAPYGQVVSVDLDDLTWKRDSLINKDNKFLRIYYEGQEKDVDEFTWIIKNNKKISSIQLNSGESTKEINLNELDKLITSYLDELGLLNIFNEFTPQIELPPQLDFNFILKNFSVKNFRSIADFKINFQNYQGLMFLSGLNGSGKSSMIEALFNALVGNRFIKRKLRKKCNDKLELDITLDYQGTEYRIVRGIGFTNLFINGVASNRSSKNATETYIIECMPFIQYLYTFYVEAKSNFFNNFFNSKLLNRLYNLDVFIKHKEMAIKKVKEIGTLILNLERESNTLDGSLSVLNSDKSNIEQKIKDMNINNDILSINTNEIESKIVKLNTEINYYDNEVERYNTEVIGNFDINEFNSLNDKISENKNKLIKMDLNNVNLNKLSDLKNKLSMAMNVPPTVIKCEECGHENIIKNNVNQSLINSFKSDIEKLESQLTSSDVVDTTELRNETKLMTDKFNALLDIKNKVDAHVSLKTAIDSKSELINNYRSELNSILNGKSIDEKLTELRNIRTIQFNYNNLNSELNKIILNIDKYNNDKIRVQSDIKNYEVSRDAYSTYSIVFDESNSNSIYKKVLIKISESLSDDEISFTNQNDTSDEESLGFQLKVDDEWIDYNDLSTGQKVYADSKLINKLFELIGNSGLLILDEFLPNVDTEHIEDCMNLINTINCKNLITTSHNPLLSGEFDHRVNCELVNNVSVYTFG